MTVRKVHGIVYVTQILVFLLASTIDLIAGIFSRNLLEFFHVFPLSLLLFPMLMEVRGDLSGIYSGRLSTGLNLETMKPSLLNNTAEFYALFQAMLTLSFFEGFMLAVIASITGILTIPGASSFIIHTMSISINCLFISAMISIPINTLITARGYSKGINPDLISYPVASSVSDLLIILVYLATLMLSLFSLEISIAITLLFATVSTFLTLRNRRNSRFISVVKEGTLAVLSTLVFGTLAGTTLTSIHAVLERNMFVMIMYPVILTLVGDVGAAIGSDMTTQIALGSVSVNFKSMILSRKKEKLSSLISMVSAISFTSILSQVVFKLSTIKFVLTLTVFTMVAVVASTMVMIVVTVLSIYTFKKGLDPDHFLIPIESSFSDFITTVLLASSLIALS